MRPYTRVYAAVSLDAVEDNIKSIRAGINPSTGIMAVVKADGYGHGAAAVAAAIEPYVCSYGVANIEEAIELRCHGIEKPILILGVTHESHYRDLVSYDIMPAMFTWNQVNKLSDIAASMGRDVKIHLAVDTGMSRIGMKPDELHADLVKEMNGLPAIRIEGIFTHFASADEKDKTSARQQLDLFHTFVKQLLRRGVDIPVKHCSNSAGIMDMREADMDVVRAGISIYGLYPSDEVENDKIILTPALELKSFVTYVKAIPAGTGVSYGATFVSPREMTVATVPVGYADGYPRNQSGVGSVLIRGKRAGILGRVCMDQFMVDVTDIPQVQEDDEVTLIGKDGRERITVEEMAGLGGGFHYEILCGIGKRVPRVYLRSGAVIGKKDHFIRNT